jgi:transposase
MSWPCAVCWRYCADDQLAIWCTRVAGLRPDRYAQELAPAKAGGIDGLAMLAQQVLTADPFDGALFAFRGKRGGLVKLLWYDGQGMCLFSKRLETGHFVWPVTETGRVSLTPAHCRCCWKGLTGACRCALLHTAHVPRVLPSLPRWDLRLRFSLASPVTATFPVCMAGRLPH